MGGEGVAAVADEVWGFVDGEEGGAGFFGDEFEGCFVVELAAFDFGEAGVEFEHGGGGIEGLGE